MTDPLRQEWLDIDGQTFAAICAGNPEAPLLLCLHGFPEYSGAFEELIPLLADRFHVVAPDQRGYGRSWKPQEIAAYAMPNLVRDAGAMIARFGQGNPAAAVIGHDWGAAVAYALAFRNPGLVSRLVVVNGVHPAPFQRALAAGGAQSVASQYIDWLRADGSERALVENDHARMFRIFSEHMDMSWMTPARRARYRNAWGDMKGVRGMVNWYRASALKLARPGAPLPKAALPRLDPEALRVHMPHLVIWGENDTALLPEARDGLHEYCDDFRGVVTVPGADHWVLHQKPQDVARHLLAFLETS
ncbi:alpha/beta fold hydrolase [Thiosulfatihalobacter marinus]|uniref:alpha/beta fold hydrolase n=1 Tax=Thiosulfatihalobacter marinus TaxID=2792481 RepID=UPI0018D7EDB6|nr:alpha/beta hydrolase [Thiosulfatihalobacter marinus]